MKVSYDIIISGHHTRELYMCFIVLLDFYMLLSFISGTISKVVLNK